jgi:hypothetical protein
MLAVTVGAMGGIMIGMETVVITRRSTRSPAAVAASRRPTAAAGLSEIVARPTAST